MPVFDNNMGDIKQVIAVRTDLGMGKGKIAAQVGHACVLGAEHVRKSHPEWFKEWWGGQEKIVVKVSGIKDLQEVKRGAIDLNLPWSEVTDAGLNGSKNGGEDKRKLLSKFQVSKIYKKSNEVQLI